MKKWYIAGINIIEYSIEYLQPEYIYGDADTTYKGPYNTFTDAKFTALALIREDIKELQRVFKEVKATKRSDFAIKK